MLAKEMRKMSEAELADKLADFRKELLTLRFQHATAQLENTARLPQLKKSIARVQTVLNAKQRGA